MVQRTGGFRRCTRHKLQKPIRKKGKISQRKYQKGMYFPRYHGMVGEVKGKKGNCYNIAIKDHNKDKLLIVHPVHLKKI